MCVYIDIFGEFLYVQVLCFVGFVVFDFYEVVIVFGVGGMGNYIVIYCVDRCVVRCSVVGVIVWVVVFQDRVEVVEVVVGGNLGVFYW